MKDNGRHSCRRYSRVRRYCWSDFCRFGYCRAKRLYFHLVNGNVIAVVNGLEVDVVIENDGELIDWLDVGMLSYHLPPCGVAIFHYAE